MELQNDCFSGLFVTREHTVFVLFCFFDNNYLKMLKFPFAVICEACGAQTVIFLSSMVSSAVICPMLGVYRDHVISMLTALGAACLAGDAIFHLIPHVSDAA